VFADKNEAVKYCNGTDTKLDGQQLVIKYFNSFPKSWKDTFHANATLNISTAMIATITSFMMQMESNARMKQLANQAKHPPKKRTGDKSRNETEAPGGRFKRAKNEKFKSKKDSRSNGKSNGLSMVKKYDHPKGYCWSCPHEHRYKDCPFNPKNNNNLLGKLKAPPKESGHNHAMQVELVQEETSSN
jgi:hypothetical protein